MDWLSVLFLIISVLLIGAILLQNRSAGLGAAFGGGAEGFHVRRGSEKLIYRTTVTLSVLFLGIAFAYIFIR